MEHPPEGPFQRTWMQRRPERGTRGLLWTIRIVSTGERAFGSPSPQIDTSSNGQEEQKLSDGFDNSGISSEEIVELRIWYPSMRAVRGHGIGNGNHRVVILNLVGVRSHTDDSKLMYRLLMTCPTSQTPNPAHSYYRPETRTSST